MQMMISRKNKSEFKKNNNNSYSYKHISECGSDQNRYKDIITFFKSETNQYFLNVLQIAKQSIRNKDLIEVSGEDYLVLEQMGSNGNIDLVGAKVPAKSAINIALMAYLFGPELKDAIYKIILEMKRDKNLNLFIIGKGPLKNEIEVFAKANKVNKQLFIIERLHNPYKLINYMDFLIVEPSSRMNTITWKVLSSYISGYIYIPGIEQSEISSSRKNMIFRNRNGDFVTEVELNNKFIGWLSKHKDHGNNIMNYDYAWFGKWVNFQELALPKGEYFLSVLINQNNIYLETPLINSINCEVPDAHYIDAQEFLFVHNQHLNNQISIVINNKTD
ncbi:hypothetical protein NC661_05285 [Aquibacillus koreensis]|uniref:Uncharacterized protein n=1 Tax=Aquibacillus koreensis TaxID=279446 RepID=A0A9X3WM32_9BACI|nr:hypothetical protein [Aquibacillus koreensis]MCT2535289.1 hypothetical protein [Aquibacillus koreensis]MDC3419779.1 hypothetical protein [Aquibacillus koreensis]